jgi:hypothetical protein
MPTTKPEKFYESSIIVKSTSDLTATLRPENDIAGVFADAEAR